MISQKELKEYLHYEKTTGVFTWIKCRKKANRIKVGDIAGHFRSDGYIGINVLGTVYSAHRLAYLYVEGYFPDDEVDHINHRKADNKWKNLRKVEHQENGRNHKKSKRNTSGVTGVSWDPRISRWCGSIGVDGKKIYLGSFVKWSEAVDARKNAEVLYGFHKNHGKD